MTNPSFHSEPFQAVTNTCTLPSTSNGFPKRRPGPQLLHISYNFGTVCSLLKCCFLHSYGGCCTALVSNDQHQGSESGQRQQAVMNSGTGTHSTSCTTPARRAYIVGLVAVVHAAWGGMDVPAANNRTPETFMNAGHHICSVSYVICDTWVMPGR